ncbi:DNA helicase RecQ [Acuticoccus yangtzensis]|uniref:DNA helicase RecQ n=1 Tax=Acuticoccus yangtzensis TaxID=1443441 RepID=UPI0009FA728E|nr:DNA helicase RecQ [Acuticoccus yangtzensis]
MSDPSLFGRPNTASPQHDAPNYDGPDYDGPDYGAPPYDGLPFDGPAYDAPPFDGPAYDSPPFDGPDPYGPDAYGPDPYGPDDRAEIAAPTPIPQTAEGVLHEVFGFSEFRPGQREIVDAVMAGEDVLAVMPTGGGKSLCYQLPALLKPGVTIVVSPLIALMRDQVMSLQAQGVAAAALNSSNDWDANRRTLHRAINGTLKLLYISPERLAHAETLERLREAPISLIAVDEAHCVSQWGHDFRPEYRQIGAVRKDLGIKQTVAFTATADKMTREDIAERLFEGERKVFLRSFDRPNISLAMSQRDEGGRQQFVAFLKAHAGEAGVVYCQSRKKVDETAAFLASRGFNAVPYHAGLTREERDHNQDVFVKGDGVIVVATVAFGMGVDKPDVRFVFHMNLPKNIESYYQEIGRAGRDGLPASAHALYGFGEIRQYRQWIEGSEAPPHIIEVENQKLNALVRMFEAPNCRRVQLLAYFGETAEPCGNCDTCNGRVETFDATVLAQKALSAVARTRERFGTEHLIAVLRGERTEKVEKHGHDTLKTFGVGADQSKKSWKSIFRQLEGLGLAGPDADDYHAWKITAAGWQVLKGETPVLLRKDTMSLKDKPAPVAKDKPLPTDYDAALFEALKVLRRQLASERGIPPYMIFQDRTLMEMAARAPETSGELRGIHGIGERKLNDYGPAFLEVIRNTVGSTAK